jgi:hypothetical protein
MYTNAELYAAMAMSSSPDMPYVYQDFNWDHCREQGYHFDDLLVQWGTQSSGGGDSNGGASSGGGDAPAPAPAPARRAV